MEPKQREAYLSEAQIKHVLMEQLVAYGMGKPDALDNQKYNKPYILPALPEMR